MINSLKSQKLLNSEIEGDLSQYRLFISILSKLYSPIEPMVEGVGHSEVVYSNYNKELDYCDIIYRWFDILF